MKYGNQLQYVKYTRVYLNKGVKKERNHLRNHLLL